MDVVCPAQNDTRFPCPAMQDASGNSRQQEDDSDVN